MRAASFVLFCVLPAASAHAGLYQGSDGSDGACAFGGAVSVPDDGRFDCESVTFTADTVFVPGSTNSPVYLLSQGAVVIPLGIAIRVNGEAGRADQVRSRGGPGGFAGGLSATGSLLPGGGLGPGGGSIGRNAGHARFADDDERRGRYGDNALLSLIGGSGGGGGQTRGGGGGGGALLIASDVSIAVSGSIEAIGGSSLDGGVGSGGAVRLVSPLISGAGTINVGAPSKTGGLAGSVGRIRFDARTPVSTIAVIGDLSQGHNLSAMGGRRSRQSFQFITIDGERVSATTTTLEVPSAQARSIDVTYRLDELFLPSDEGVRVRLSPEHGPPTELHPYINNGPFLMSSKFSVPGGQRAVLEMFTAYTEYQGGS